MFSELEYLKRRIGKDPFQIILKSTPVYEQRLFKFMQATAQNIIYDVKTIIYRALNTEQRISQICIDLTFLDIGNTYYLGNQIFC